MNIFEILMSFIFTYLATIMDAHPVDVPEPVVAVTPAPATHAAPVIPPVVRTPLSTPVPNVPVPVPTPAQDPVLEEPEYLGQPGVENRDEKDSPEELCIQQELEWDGTQCVQIQLPEEIEARQDD